MASARQVSEIDVSPISTTFACSFCQAPAARSTCSKCAAIRYCSKECQAAQWPAHKEMCKVIKNMRADTKREAAPLRRYRGVMGRETPYNLFKSADEIGDFWGYHDPRDYCKTRYFLAQALHKCGTENNSKLALELATEHVLDLLWMCRGDNLGARYVLPTFLIDQDRLQESYDLIKWWQTCDPDGRYDWGNLSLPYLNLCGEDMLESLEELKLDKFAECRTLMSLALIKLRLKAQLTAESTAEKSRFDTLVLGTHCEVSPLSKIGGCVPVLHQIQKHAVTDKVKSKLAKLDYQITELVKRMNKANKYLIPAMFNPDKILVQEPPQYVSGGSMEEVWSALQEGVFSWQQTDGAMEELRRIYKNL